MEVKTLKTVNTVTTVNSNQTFPIVDSNGNITRITLDTLRKVITSGLDLNAIEDGIYVNPAWLNPVPGTSDIGRGVFWTGETDLNW